MKRYVGSCWTKNRNIAQIIRQLQIGLYGGIDEKGGVILGAVRPRCRSFITHALKEIAKAADQDDELEDHEGYSGIYLPPLLPAEVKILQTIRSEKKSEHLEALEDYWDINWESDGDEKENSPLSLKKDHRGLHYFSH